MSNFYDEYPEAGDIFTPDGLVSLAANPNVTPRVLQLIINDEFEVVDDGSDPYYSSALTSCYVDSYIEVLENPACDYDTYNMLLEAVFRAFTNWDVERYQKIFEDAIRSNWTSPGNLSLLINGLMDDFGNAPFPRTRHIEYLRDLLERVDITPAQRESLTLKSAELLLLVDWDI
jgi:hypothetical protein